MERVAHFLSADQDPPAISLVKRLHGLVELRGGVRVEPVAWLVDDQDGRLQHERARQRRASAVEAGELVRRALEVPATPTS